MKTETSLSSCLGLLFGFLIVAIGGSIVSGYVLSVMWGWFIAGIFNLPLLTIPQAIGFSMVVSMLTNHQDLSNKEEKDTTTVLLTAMGKTLIAPFITLFIGWIVYKFI